MNHVNIAFCHALQTKNGYYSTEYLTATVEILQRLIFLSDELQRTRNRNDANLQCVRRNEMKQSLKALFLSVFQLCEALSYSNQGISDACIYCLYKIVNGKCFEQKCELRFFSICFGSLDSNYSCHLGLTQARRVSEISKTISPKQTSKKYSACPGFAHTEKVQRILPQEDLLPLASVYLKQKRSLNQQLCRYKFRGCKKLFFFASRETKLGRSRLHYSIHFLCTYHGQRARRIAWCSYKGIFSEKNRLQKRKI